MHIWVIATGQKMPVNYNPIFSASGWLDGTVCLPSIGIAQADYQRFIKLGFGCIASFLNDGNINNQVLCVVCPFRSLSSLFTVISIVWCSSYCELLLLSDTDE